MLCRVRPVFGCSLAAAADAWAALAPEQERQWLRRGRSGKICARESPGKRNGRDFKLLAKLAPPVQRHCSGRVGPCLFRPLLIEPAGREAQRLHVLAASNLHVAIGRDEQGPFAVRAARRPDGEVLVIFLKSGAFDALAAMPSIMNRPSKRQSSIGFAEILLLIVIMNTLVLDY